MPTSLSGLAYEIAVRAIADQTRALDDLRSRAGTLLAAAALVTTFLGGTALDERKFDILSLAGVAIACFVAMALLTFVIVWPFDFGFSLSARTFVAEAQAHELDVDRALLELAVQLELDYDANARTIRMLFRFFRGAILLLVGETAAWIVVLWRI